MRNGASVWHCHRISPANAEVPMFAAPVEYKLGFNHLTIQPTGGFTNVLEFGESVNKTWNGMATISAFDGVFKEGDVMYLDGKAPNAELESEYGYGYTANAKITSAREQNKMIRLIIKTITE